MPISSPYDHLPLRSAAKSAFSSLHLTPAERDTYERHAVYERLTQPRRFTRFTVPWMDDTGCVRVSRGFFAVGAAFPPRRCSLFFHPRLDEGQILTRSFLEQLEDSLRGDGSGTALCGIEAQAAALSCGESMRLCRSAAASLMSCGLPRDMEVLPDAPSPERDYLCGALGDLDLRIADASPGEDAVGTALCFFALHALRRASPLERRGVAVIGAGPCADAACRMAGRLGARVSRELSPGADVIFLCGDAPASAEMSEHILALRPAGVFEGAHLACTPQAAARFHRSGILFVPAFAVRACVSPRERSTSPWEAEKSLRDAAREMALDLLARGDGDIFRGAHARALSACAMSLIRRGV